MPKDKAPSAPVGDGGSQKLPDEQQFPPERPVHGGDDPTETDTEPVRIEEKVARMQAKLSDEHFKAILDQLNESEDCFVIRGLLKKANEYLAETTDMLGGTETPFTDLYLHKEMKGEGSIRDYVMSAAGRGPSRIYALVVQPLRERFIQEYDVKTVPEYMLLDRIMFAYLRATQLDAWTNTILGQASMHKSEIEFFRLLEDAKEKAERQLVRNLEALKRLKMPSMNLNIRRVDKLNVANQQQVNVGQGYYGSTGDCKCQAASQLITEGDGK